MKLVTLNALTVYRMHSPRRAVSPTSGAGASTHGGRANRLGVEALYLSLEFQTAVHEYQQLSRLLPPGTLVSYEVTATPIVDFTNGYRENEWDPIWQDFYCDWRAMWFDQRIEPPSWVIGDLVIAAGAKGILFKSAIDSFAGTNLVLFNSTLDEDDALLVNDPKSTLPKSMASWD